MLVDSQQIHDPDEPEDEIQTVADPPCCPVGLRKPTQCQSSQKKKDGQEI